MSRRVILPLVVALAVYGVLQAAMSLNVLNLYWQRILQLAIITGISALGLNLIYGFTGQFSLGHAAFYGIGAYCAAYITKTWAGGGYLAFVVGLIAGTLLAGLVAFLIGLPILRLRSDYLGIATLAFGIIVRNLIENMDFIGGPRGMIGIRGFTNFAWVFAFGLAAVLVLRNLIYSSIGRALLSIREDEIAAEATGINTTRYKTMGFVIGCCFAGLAGGLLAHLDTFLHPSKFDFLKSIDVLLIVVLGGMGSISGTIVAAIALTFLLEGLRGLPAAIVDWRLVIYPLLLIVVMLLRPKGIFGGREFRFLMPTEGNREWTRIHANPEETNASKRQ